MSHYAYIARTRTGERVEGDIDAVDKRAALGQLERMGVVPVSVTENGAKASKPPSQQKKKKMRAATPSSAAQSLQEAGTGWRNRPTRMKLREVLLFTRELSDLLSSGMTLGRALDTLAKRDTSKAQDRIVSELRDDIVQGSSLSEALAKHPASFSGLYASMVKAGEASGTLPDVLERLCFHFERVQDAREKVLMALVYPTIILLVGAATLVFSMVFVIPRFIAIFNELESDLPGSTQLLANISSFLTNYWWALILAGIGGYFLFMRMLSTPAGLRKWHATQLRIPLVRNIVKANAFAHFARTLGTLLANGVPVLKALSIVADTVENKVITDEILDARERVTDGSTISEPLAQGHVFPRLLTDMLAVGEESGDMSSALIHIANRYERELDRTVNIFTTVLEPVMILVMAVLVGFVAISMLTAVFDMTSGLNP